MTILILLLGLLVLVASVRPMAALTSTNPTLADIITELDPDGDSADIVRMLEQTNAMLADEHWVESNDVSIHQVTVETSMPDVYWRSYNMGVPSSKATSAQVNEPMAMMEARSNIDSKLVAKNGGATPRGQMYRLNQARRFVEAMNQEKMRKTIYGNHAVDSKTFTGLAPRYSSLSAGNAQNILDAGGTGSDLTSVWLIGWGPDTVYSVYPKDSIAGLQRRDLGEQMLQNVNGNSGESMQAMCELFQWDCGLAIADWRYAVRIANIDVSDLVGITGTQALTAFSTHLIHLMIRALDRIPNPEIVNLAFYGNRSVRSALGIHAWQKNQAVLDIEKGVRQFKMNFLGHPFRLVDQLVNTESQVA